MEPELIISNVLGSAPQSRLYGIGDNYWVIKRVDVVAAVNAAIEQMSDLGIEPPAFLRDAPVRATTHVEIYRAQCGINPVYDWQQTSGGEDDPTVEFGHTYIDDDHMIVTKDGAEYARLERVKIRDEYDVTLVDADGDPLNGLTPWAVLPHGTTFEQALDHIAQEA